MRLYFITLDTCRIESELEQSFLIACAQRLNAIFRSNATTWALFPELLPSAGFLDTFAYARSATQRSRPHKTIRS